MSAETIAKPTVQLHHGDCLEFMKTLEPGSVDAVVTDPPYGVRFKGKATKHTACDGEGYRSLEDSPEYIKSVVVPVIEMCISLSERTIVTPGVRNLWAYPEPDDVGGVYCPSGAGASKWGFTCLHPILYYGRCPRLQRGLGSTPNSFSSTERAEKNGHPCPKPIGWMKWLVSKAALPGMTVFDPFMGSGTTGVACVKAGINFIGCEIDPAYFAIAQRRIAEASNTLF